MAADAGVLPGRARRDRGDYFRQQVAARAMAKPLTGVTATSNRTVRRQSTRNITGSTFQKFLAAKMVVPPYGRSTP